MKRDRIISIIGWLLSAASIIYFSYYIENNFSAIPDVRIDTFSIILFALLVMLYVLGIFVAALAWNILLKQHDFSFSTLNVIAVYCRAQFAKYLPWNIGHHVVRVLLAKRAGVPMHVTIQTMMLETAWFVSIAAALSLMALYSYTFDTAFISLPYINIELMFVGVVLGSMFIPIVMIKILNRYFFGIVERITGSPALSLPTVLDGTKVLIMMLICFVIVGVIIELLALLIYEVNDSQIIYLIGIYALSWIAGYLVPGAPAGLGVREAVMVSTLEPIYGSGIAISISVSLRVISTLGDVMAFAVSFLFGNIVLESNK